MNEFCRICRHAINQRFRAYFLGEETTCDGAACHQSHPVLIYVYVLFTRYVKSVRKKKLLKMAEKFLTALIPSTWPLGLEHVVILRNKDQPFENNGVFSFLRSGNKGPSQVENDSVRSSRCLGKYDGHISRNRAANGFSIILRDYVLAFTTPCAPGGWHTLETKSLYLPEAVRFFSLIFIVCYW